MAIPNLAGADRRFNHLWSLLIAALLSFAGAGGLVFLAIKRSKDLRFCATWRQLGLKFAPTPNHE